MRHQVAKITFLLLSFWLLPSSPSKAEPFENNAQVLALRESLIWTDESGDPVTLSNWKGKELLLTFTYTGCNVSCPLTMRKLIKVESILKSRGKSVEFIFISLNPRVDTPSRLSQYKKRWNLNQEHWHFLSGSEEDTHKLAHALGVHYVTVDNHIEHDKNIFFISGDGVVKKVFDGWGFSGEELF